MRVLRIIPLFFAGVAALQACKEDNPGITYEVPEKPLLDTTYTVSSIPAAQDHNVLLFDITGVRCVNCPQAARLALKLADTLHTGRVSVVALYPTSQSSLTMPWGGGYDTLNCEAAELISSAYGAPPYLPIGMVDQVEISGSRLISPTSWSNTVNNRLSMAGIVNIDLNTKWITADNKSRLEAKITFTQSSADKQLVFIAIVEDDVIGRQTCHPEDTIGGFKTLYDWRSDGYFYAYRNNHVLRKLLTSTTGDTLMGSISPGRVFEKQYYVQPRSNWKAVNLYGVVWVVDAVTKEVQQVAHAKLQP